MATNMKENGFETMIVKYLVENNHYEEGSNSDYNKIYAIDEVRLFRFLHDTQYEKLAELRIEDNEIEKKKFLDRLSKKISDDGVINIIRKGMKYKNKTVDFYMVRPSEGNQEAKESYDKNIFSVTRQLRYSNDYGRLALDVCIFLNGLPIITMELKNQITKQNHDDAIRQYMTDRTPDELLFQFKRCIVHFAVDDDEIYMCTELKKEKSFFMPFNKGNNNGAGNPRNPNGLKTDYLWKDILTKPCLSNILENYVQITEEKDEDTGRKSYKQIFPRYHQLSVVTSLLADAKNDGPGHRYLIQHSAGSGKSNSIAWLAHQLVTLKKDKKDVFDTVIVVTDRVNLDKQIRDTIKQFMQVSSTVGWAKDASTLSTLMEQGKKIIIKGQARAMVVASNIKRAVEYYMAISRLLEERKSPYKAIVAFTGEIKYEGVTYNEAKLNGFPSSQIEKKFRKDPYRLLIVANKFQTGYDEPLLQTMYVDKGLSDIKAVQTLSRLNRCYPNKNEVFVLDFQNDPADIKTAFDKYYKTTILSGETDVNKLNDLVDEMEPLDVYSDEEVTEVAELYLDNADRTKIDPIIDKGTERYKELEYDDQVDFKSSAKTFLRTYNFLSSILPYGSMDWERLSIYLTFLVSKLPKPDNGNADEIMEDVELESYRLVAQDTISIKLEDKDSEIEPIPVKTDVGIPVPELDTLSNILASFHEMWGNCEWTDEDRIRKQIAELPDIVEQDETYQNAMKYSDAQNARDESDRATYDAILKSLVSGTELYKAFSDDIRNKNNQSFKKWLLDYVFNVTYKPESRE